MKNKMANIGSDIRSIVHKNPTISCHYLSDLHQDNLTYHAAAGYVSMVPVLLIKKKWLTRVKDFCFFSRKELWCDTLVHTNLIVSITCKILSLLSNIITKKTKCNIWVKFQLFISSFDSQISDISQRKWPQCPHWQQQPALNYLCTPCQVSYWFILKVISLNFFYNSCTIL